MNQSICPLVLVTEQDQLVTLCQGWSALPLLAIDTEFMRTNTFYPLPALLQVGDGKANYLLDPLSLTDLTPLKILLMNGDVQKVLHACSEDLEVFQRLFGALPVNLFDTQIAAAYCGYGFSVGYANLVGEILNVQLPKGETRSDWLQRPLTDAQQHYAAMDVEYLFVMAQILQRQLQEKNRYGWVTEECDNLLRSYAEAQNPDNAIQRLRNAWRMDERQFGVLTELARWRDLTAQEQDVPRSYVLKDKSLYDIAEILPTHLGQLRKVTELSEKAIRRYGEKLIDLVDQVHRLPEDRLPRRLQRPPSSRQQAQIKLMRESLQTVAQNLNIAPECLARKKDFEFIVRALADGLQGDAIFPDSFSGWRSEFAKPALLDVL